MNRQQQRFLERQNEKMASRITGPDGRALSSVPDAEQPQSPFLDIKQADGGPTFRLPVAAVGYIQPDVLDALAQAIASKIVQATLEMAANTGTHVEPT
jgi:hypothetical protein